MDLRIDRVSDTQITPTLVKNCSYFSTYLSFKNNEMNFTTLDDGRIKITGESFGK